jgi:hypothetical protein
MTCHLGINEFLLEAVTHAWCRRGRPAAHMFQVFRLLYADGREELDNQILP